MCHHCGTGMDSAQHTLEECISWTVERSELRLAIGGDLSLPVLIRRMFASEDGWKAAARFADVVMLQKEEEERVRRRNAAVGNRTDGSSLTSPFSRVDSSSSS